MASSPTTFIKSLVLKEIRHLVAAAEGATLSSSACVDRVIAVYPTCGLTRREIEDMVIEQAARAKVPIEMDGDSPRGLPRSGRAPVKRPRRKPPQPDGQGG